jgi:hypothetical protein
MPDSTLYCFSHTLIDGELFAPRPTLVIVVVMTLASGEMVIRPLPVTTPFRLRVDTIV